MKRYQVLSTLLIPMILLAGCLDRDNPGRERLSSVAEEETSYAAFESSHATLFQSSSLPESDLGEESAEASPLPEPEGRRAEREQASAPQQPAGEPSAAASALPSRQSEPADSRPGSSGQVVWPSSQPDSSGAAPEAASPERPDSPDQLQSPGGIDAQLFESELIRLINAEREQQGKQSLRPEDDMRWAARIRASEVLDSLSHTRPDGTSYYTAFDEAGFAYAGKWHGENVSYLEFTGNAFDTFSAARHMFDGLKSSPGHYTNMLNENFAQIGVGVSVESIGGGGVRVGSAQMFAGL